jgi:hypothetical protein
LHLDEKKAIPVFLILKTFHIAANRHFQKILKSLKQILKGQHYWSKPRMKRDSTYLPWSQKVAIKSNQSLK